MEPVSGRLVGSASSPPPAREAVARPVAAPAVSDGVQAAAAPPRLVELLAPLPLGSSRTDRLLGPPPRRSLDPAVGRFAAVSSALRSLVRRTRAAGRAEDELLAAAAALPGGAALRSAIECEARLGSVVAELCGMRESVAAGIAAVTVG